MCKRPFTNPHWVEDRAQPFLARTNALIAGCATRGVPIVRILHSGGPATASNRFAIKSGFVRPLSDPLKYDLPLRRA